MRLSPRCIAFLAALSLLPVLHAPAHAVSRPELVFSAGSTFAVAGDPNGGGMSTGLAALWPAGDRAHFGVALSADDMGTDLGVLRDPHDGTPLGSVALGHRWVYGLAWRGDVAVLRGRRWQGTATGQWGWWRLEDDRRGALVHAGTSIGYSLGADVYRVLHGPQSMGLAVRYHHLFTDHSAPYRALDHYASVALAWRWAGSR